MCVYNLIVYLPMYICSPAQMKETDPSAGWSKSACVPRHASPSRSGSRIKPSLSLSPPRQPATRWHRRRSHPGFCVGLPPRPSTSTANTLRRHTFFTPTASPFHLLSKPPPHQIPPLSVPLTRPMAYAPYPIPSPSPFSTCCRDRRPDSPLLMVPPDSPSRSPHVVICSDITPTIPVC